MDRSKNKGVIMAEESYRKKRLKFRIAQFKKQWNIFYKSVYGRVGFYILVGFIVITVLSPLIIQHSDPVTYIAPPEDFYVASNQLTSHLSFNPEVSGSLMKLTATSSTPEGSYLVFGAGHTGTSYALYGLSVNNGREYRLFNISSAPLGLRAFTVGDYNKYAIAGVLSLNTYLLVYTNNDVYIAKINWSGSSYGSGTPSASVSSIHEKNIIYSTTSAMSYHESYSGIPNFNEICNPAYIFTVNNNGTYHLNEYTLTGSMVWSKPINNLNNPHFIYYGSLLGNSNAYNDGGIIISSGNRIMFYSVNGTEIYNKTVPVNVSGMYIPLAYNEGLNKYNSLFFYGNNSVYSLNLVNFTLSSVFKGNSKITGVSSTAGESGFPSTFVVTTSKNIYLLSGPGRIQRTVTSPFYISGIVPDYGSSTFLLYDNSTGDFVYMEYLSSKDPFGWGLDLKEKISNPEFLLNSKTAGESIAFVSSSNFYLYSTAGKDINPLPPTFHTLSGNSFPLGTNSEGNDVWSLFIGSFPIDLEVGFVVGIAILIIAAIISMFIGYFSGMVSAVIETITLAIYLIPGLPFLIVMAKILGPSIPNIILILTFLGWEFATFTLIGVVRGIKSRTFVDAAKVSGASTMQILRRHMFPNMGPLLVYITAINIGGAVGSVSTLEILGLAPLTVPTWGGMLSGFYSDFFDLAIAPWWFIPPIVAITLFIMAFIFIARGLDEVVNPRVGGRR